MRSWLWLAFKVGPIRTYRYWRLGQERGWMTPEESAEFGWQIIEAAAADLPEDEAQQLREDYRRSLEALEGAK